MARALGIGGVFFKCEDPSALITWYREWLGFDPAPFDGAVFRAANLPADAYGVFGPFGKTTDYFDPSAREFMINLVVDDLDGALAQVVEGGAERIGEIVSEEQGRFGWFIDPAGTKVELWEPAAT